MDSREYMNRTVDYVLTGDVWAEFEIEVTCPECGGKAIKKDYERVDGGAVNSYDRIRCGECGYLKDTGAIEDYDPEASAREDAHLMEMIDADTIELAMDAMGIQKGHRALSVLECMLVASEYQARSALRLSDTHGMYEDDVELGCYMLAGWISASEARYERRPSLPSHALSVYGRGQQLYREGSLYVRHLMERDQ